MGDTGGVFAHITSPKSFKIKGELISKEPKKALQVSGRHGHCPVHFIANVPHGQFQYVYRDKYHPSSPLRARGRVLAVWSGT